MNKIGVFILGASLIEFMISACLGLILLTNIVSFYLRQLEIFKFHYAISYLQETGRFANYLFSQELHLAGYLGCSKLEDINLPLQPIFGVSQKTINLMPEIPSFIISKIKPNTDIILINQLTPIISNLTDKISTNADTISIKKNIFTKNYFYIFSDCTHIEKHQLLRTDTINQVHISPPIKNEFAAQTEISKFQQKIYFIMNTKRKNNQGKPIYALSRYNVNQPHTPQELLEGIENMRIFYGLILNGKIKFFSAENLKKQDWKKIKIIRIHLLLTHVEPLFKKIEYYHFLGHRYLSNDHNLKKEWIITIGLRQNVW
ncbi:MAG: hypothetical protein LEGION0398_MBIBDBAK_00816 [Legionellaceae bacterium]